MIRRLRQATTLHAATLAAAGAKLVEAAIQQELGNGAGELEEEFRAEDYPSFSAEDGVGAPIP